MCHLKLAYSRDAENGVKLLFTETTGNNDVRVTKTLMNIKDVTTYLAK